MPYNIRDEVEIGSRIDLWDDNRVQVWRLQLRPVLLATCASATGVPNLVIPLPSSRLGLGHSQQHLYGQPVHVF